MSDFSLSTRPVASLDAEARGQFVINVYRHLLLAIGVFVGFEAALFATGLAESIFEFVFRTGGFLPIMLFMGLFYAGSMIATRASNDLGNVQMQFLGLFGMAGVYSVFFAPLLYRAFNDSGGTATVGAAAVLTAVGFTCLTTVAFVTRRDLSFLRGFIMWGFGLAFVAIFGGILFGFQLGIWFSVAMIGLAGAAILYQTQQIIARYPSEAYVGAAVQLFGSVMMMFFYILRLLMQLRD